MKGQHLVIGLVVFVLAVVVVLYLTMTATFNKDENGMEPAVSIIEVVDETSLDKTKALADLN